MTDQRPPLNRKHTRKSEESRDAALDQGIRMTIDGEPYEARVGDISPSLAREIRSTTGRSFMKLLGILADDPDVDVVSEFVWVARRIRGESVDLDDVQVTYAALLSENFDIAHAGAEELDDSPEA